MPDTIAAHDNFRTRVVADGGASADPLDDPDGTGVLEYQWQIEEDEFRIEAGQLSDAQIELSFRGDRPAVVRLTVTDGEGSSATATARLRLSVSARP